MNWIVDLISFFIRGFFYRQALRKAKSQGLLVYLKALQAVRKALAGGLLFFVLIQLMIFGLIGSVVTLVLLGPQDVTTKLSILFVIFAALFLIPFLFLLAVFSEKTWFKISGAEKLIRENDL